MNENNTVFIQFLSGRTLKVDRVVKVDTDIEYSIYQLTDEYGRQWFAEGKQIEYIYFGSEVEVIEH